jgi:drug efflux transport system ATP-binding protein
MLAGVLRPTEGDALVRGASVARDPEAAKQHIAYMSQHFGLYADLTVRENIDFYADLYEVPDAERPARLERLYHFSNLAPFERRLAGQLSGGMKQKLGLCCALVHQPEILLLDEPTFGVDPISRRDLWLILDEMLAQQVTVLVSTAYLDEAERCDRVALLDNGRLLALDRPGMLQRQLGGAMVAVRASDPRRAARVLAGTAHVRRATLFGDEVHVTMASKDADWPGVRATLEAAGFAEPDAEDIEPSLEDVFIERVSSAGIGSGGA